MNIEAQLEFIKYFLFKKGKNSQLDIEYKDKLKSEGNSLSESAINSSSKEDYKTKTKEMPPLQNRKIVNLKIRRNIELKTSEKFIFEK